MPPGAIRQRLLDNLVQRSLLQFGDLRVRDGESGRYRLKVADQPVAERVQRGDVRKRAFPARRQPGVLLPASCSRRWMRLRISPAARLVNVTTSMRERSRLPR